MATETAERRSVKLPGGVIAHLEGGSSVTLRYGDSIPDNLASYVDPNTFSDTAPRTNPRSQELEAHRRAALTENGQLNSSSSVVPGNYSDLDEDAASRLMSNLAIRPAAQVALAKYEILFGGNRQKVLDACSDSALIEANMEIEDLDRKALIPSGATTEPTAGSLGDPDLQSPEQAARLRAASLKTPAPAEAPDRVSATAPREPFTPPDGNDLPPAGSTEVTDPAELHGNDKTIDGGEVPAWDAKDENNANNFVWTKAKLHAYADQHSIEVGASDNRDTLVEKISAKHSAPETPPPAE